MIHPMLMRILLCFVQCFVLTFCQYSHFGSCLCEPMADWAVDGEKWSAMALADNGVRILNQAGQCQSHQDPSRPVVVAHEYADVVAHYQSR